MMTWDDDLGERKMWMAFVNAERVGSVDVVFVCDQAGSMSSAWVTELRRSSCSSRGSLGPARE